MDARSPLALVLSWLGAIIFVASLAYFLFSYVVTFGLVASGADATTSITWNVTLFTLFALHHSVFARERVRRVIARKLPEPLERSFYVWVASLMFMAVCGLWRPVPGIAWDIEGPWRWSLHVLQAGGVWLTLHSAAILGVRDLAGLQTSNPTVEFRRSGPYKWVRHPIYSGWFLMVCAASPMTMTRLVFAAVSCGYLLLAIPLEERSMRLAGSDAYARYAAQVRWRLLPGLY